jgi:hypothetical protein
VSDETTSFYSGKHGDCEVDTPHVHPGVVNEPGYQLAATAAVADTLATFYLSLRERKVPKTSATAITIAWLTSTLKQ